MQDEIFGPVLSVLEAWQTLCRFLHHRCYQSMGKIYNGTDATVSRGF